MNPSDWQEEFMDWVGDEVLLYLVDGKACRGVLLGVLGGLWIKVGDTEPERAPYADIGEVWVRKYGPVSPVPAGGHTPPPEVLTCRHGARLYEPVRIGRVMILGNGRVAVFDRYRRQISEFQGEWKEKEQAIRARADTETVWEDLRGTEEAAPALGRPLTGTSLTLTCSGEADE